MTKELIVALEISRSELAGALAGLAKGIPGVKTVEWTGNLGEKGALAVKVEPDIIVIDDAPESNNLLNRVRIIKDNFPQVALLVVSSNCDPQQIINTMKAGAAEYLVQPVTHNVFINAIEEVRAKLAKSGHLARGNVYSFIGAKGGVGATVLAVNTAAALAMQPKSATALIDMSLESGDASVLLDIVPQTTIHDICIDIQRLDVALLHGAMIPHNTGLHFLAAPQNPEDGNNIRGEQVSRIFDLTQRIYDHTVIDCASMNINDCSIEALRHSDKVFVVTDMLVPSIRNTVRLCKLIHKLGVGDNKVEIIVNRFIKDNVLSVAEIEKNLGKSVYWIVPSDFAEIVISINRGIPMIKLSAGSSFSKNMLQFVRKFQNRLDDPNFRGIRGMFGKAI